MSARSLRPGGTALRPGGVGRGYKGGAGSSTDYSSSRASSTGALSIDYRYTKDELMSIRPASAAPVPSHLRVLPSYVVRGAIGVKAGGQGTSVLVANEGQWGRGQQHGYPNQGRGGTGGECSSKSHGVHIPRVEIHSSKLERGITGSGIHHHPRWRPRTLI